MRIFSLNISTFTPILDTGGGSVGQDRQKRVLPRVSVVGRARLIPRGQSGLQTSSCRTVCSVLRRRAYRHRLKADAEPYRHLLRGSRERRAQLDRGSWGPRTPASPGGHPDTVRRVVKVRKPLYGNLDAAPRSVSIHGRGCRIRWHGFRRRRTGPLGLSRVLRPDRAGVRI